MKTCVMCNFLNQAAAQFCVRCGGSLQDPAGARATQLIGQAVTSLFKGTKTMVQRACVVASSLGANGLSRLPNDVRQGQREMLAIANDVSGSMRGSYTHAQNKMQAAAHASATMVREKAAVDPLDEIGLVAFADHAWVVEQLRPVGANQVQLINAVQNTSSGGGTDIDAGLRAADGILQWHRQGVVRRIVLLTDGHGGDPRGTAASLKSRGVVIDCIGVGENPSGVDEPLLRQVASVVQGQVRYRFIKDSRALAQHYTMLAGKTQVR